MILKLKILTVIILLNFTIFSQIDTNKVCLPYQISKKIAIDLIRGDSAIAELKQTNILINQYKQSIIERDTIIELYKKKTDLYIKEISLRDTTLSLQKYMIYELKYENQKQYSQLKIYKTTTKYLSVGLMGTLAVISYILYIK